MSTKRFERIKELVEAYRSQSITPTNQISGVIRELKGEKTNAVLGVLEDSAQEAAKRSTARYRSGHPLGPLDGVPIAIKDNIAIQGEALTAGSAILKGTISPYDATVVKKLKQAGAIPVARTNLDEFAMGSSTEHSAFGPTKNPHDSSRVAGGSSGGSASVVAQGIVPAALGSDTGGSIRQPAAFCGVVGLKPTYGSVSRFGLVALANSFDVIGPLTQTVEDAELIFNTIKGKDPMDATLRDDVQQKKQIKTIGIPTKWWGTEKTPQAAAREKTRSRLEQLGYITKDIELSEPETALAIYYIVTPTEASSNLGRYDGIRYGNAVHTEHQTLLERYVKTRTKGFGTEVKRRIFLGTFAASAGYLEAYYTHAKKIAQALRKEYAKIFEDVDLIMTPTTTTPAFKIGTVQNPLAMYYTDILTVTANVIGAPAISVPDDQINKLPFGVQFIAPWFGEGRLFRVGKAFLGESNG